MQIWQCEDTWKHIYLFFFCGKFKDTSPSSKSTTARVEISSSLSPFMYASMSSISLSLLEYSSVGGGALTLLAGAFVLALSTLVCLVFCSEPAFLFMLPGGWIWAPSWTDPSLLSLDARTETPRSPAHMTARSEESHLTKKFTWKLRNNDLFTKSHNARITAETHKRRRGRVILPVPLSNYISWLFVAVFSSLSWRIGRTAWAIFSESSLDCWMMKPMILSSGSSNFLSKLARVHLVEFGAGSILIQFRKIHNLQIFKNDSRHNSNHTL